MPVVNYIIGGSADFTNQFVVLKEPAGYTGAHTYDAMSKAGALILGWGSFLTILINFVLLALVIFWMIKLMNRLKSAPAPEAAPATPEDVLLLREIRDSLKK
jgi:large conductance mechanosensitive channel